MMRTFASIALTACALALSNGAAAQPRFDSLVIFGTSLSDPGNFFAVLGGNNTPPTYLVDPLLVPSVPYARGGHHFSDGVTWVEQLARSLGMAASAKPALANESKKAGNYAVAGARANYTATGIDLADQTAVFLRDRGNVANPDALYVVEMGGNDIRDAVIAFVQPPEGTTPAEAAGAVIRGALESIGQNIGLLYGKGARKFLVANAPDLGLTPAIRALGAGSLATGLSQSFNAGLEGEEGVLSRLRTDLPGIEIFQLDIFGKLQAIVEQPENFGLSNVTAACITPDVAPYHCKDFKDYLFWDGIHPTAAAHAIVAQEAAVVLR
ncbi:MAG TPA: SGNH/GDSL hydrolase family protein [Burkholderiales bacterium]|nr:SGNH/GDSL hydrolase family protein [Burkholderiales bacterium]